MESRRAFLKKATYCAPVLISIAVRPSFAGTTYGNPGNPGGGGGTGTTPTGGRSHHHGGGGEWWQFWTHL